MLCATRLHNVPDYAASACPKPLPTLACWRCSSMSEITRGWFGCCANVCRAAAADVDADRSATPGRFIELLSGTFCRCGASYVTRSILLFRRTHSDMESLIQDLKHSLRMFIQVPAFTLTAILALALGIGANTAIFTIVNR